MADVRTQSDAVGKMAEYWHLIDALMGGTAAMRKEGNKYLPQWPAEDPDAYKSRLATATLFPAYARTVSVMTGKPFSKPITVGNDVPARIKEFLQDVDLQNRNIMLLQPMLRKKLCAWPLRYPRRLSAQSRRQDGC